MRPIVFSAIVLCSAPSIIFAEAAPRPNILYFYVDDMGWGSIGPNGQAARRAKNLPYVRTPNLDRLAAEGINFTRGYGCTVCSPARSSLQTGFHQGHTFADRNDPNNAKKAIRADDPSIGKSLSAAGYVTGYWGKWGYGGSKDQLNPVIENVQTLPTSHGYRHVLAELHHVRAHTFFQPTLWSAPVVKDYSGGLKLVPNSLSAYQGREDYPQQPALQDHADYPSTAYCDDSYAFAALDFVRKQSQNYNRTGQPFHGLLAVQIPHAPFGEISQLPDWDNAYRRARNFDSLADQTRQWAAMVTRIDAHFGNILKALEDPNNDGDSSDSVANNTLVIFQSDNGGPSGKNNTELDANGGLSGNKGKIQEGGIRVPLIMRWPAKISADTELKAGTNSNMVVDVTDMLPTFCELAGAPIPVGIDGVSIAPTLIGNGQQRRREFIIHEAGNGQSIIQGHYKLVKSRRSPLRLFDLSQDHSESVDIAAKHPKLVKQLESLLLGERVSEPKGFANTYHHWSGVNGAATSDPDSWSDYKYSNAGITYMEDGGAPQLSWIARMENTGSSINTAFADEDLAVLGMEIRGNETAKAVQVLRLRPNISLTGRNEVRLGSLSRLVISGGTVSSMRWVDIQEGGELKGHGTVAADVYNAGFFSPSVWKGQSLEIEGDYNQQEGGELFVALDAQPQAAIRVSGTANLNGLLAADLARSAVPPPGSQIKVLTADSIKGKFDNPDNEVLCEDGVSFAIEYTASSVSLIRK